MSNKEYIINPSALSHFCSHCEYLKQNHNLYNSSVSAGITQTLDSLEKDYFLGDCRKIDSSLPEGEVIDPYNDTFFSKILEDNKGRPFRIKGKGDAIIKFKDNTCGIIDYKTSKFQKHVSKPDSFKPDDLAKKIREYDPQLHAYYLLYSNLEKDKFFLRDQYIKRYRAKKEETIKKGVKRVLEKIADVEVNKAKIFGLVFIYPEGGISSEGINIKMTHKFCEVQIDLDNFLEKITWYLDIMHQKEPPPPPESCNNCIMHKYFFDQSKLI